MINKYRLVIVLQFFGAGLCFGLDLEDKLSVVANWSYLEYAYDNPEHRANDIANGNWIPARPVPIDVDVHYNRLDNRRTIFVTSPRIAAGIPATLSTLVFVNNTVPSLKPYPSWEWHQNVRTCKQKRIVSVFRTIIDECDRLWVLDNGNDETGLVCSPQVLAFDLHTNNLVHQYDIPIGSKRGLYFVTPAVEVLSRDHNCTDTFLYLADSDMHTLWVHDVNRYTSWFFEHESMNPDPNFTNYNISGTSFSLADGILGMAIPPQNHHHEERKLFYHAMSSETEHWVYTRHLRNQSLVASNYSWIFHSYNGTRGTQSPTEAIDSEGVMFFGLLSEVNIACFNTHGEYGRNSTSFDIVADNKEKLQFPSGIKVIDHPYISEKLWILTSRYQLAVNQLITNATINFRIMSGNVRDLKQGTKCHHY